MKEPAQFFAFREYDDSELFFGCRINGKDIYFYPIKDEVNYLITTIAIHPDILECSPEEITEIHKIYSAYSFTINLYFEIIWEWISWAYPRSALEKVLQFDLTDEEKAKVFAEINKLTFIYLIKDNRTGYTKIGRSNDPEERLRSLIRQATLMPEENDFGLVFYWEDYPYVEKVLHEKYNDKRKRGEWFDLSGEDIEKLINQYNE